MTTAILDLMARLTAHMEAAEKVGGAAVTKGSEWYGKVLERLDAKSRQEIVRHCRAHGFEAELGAGPYGGAYVSLRKLGNAP